MFVHFLTLSRNFRFQPLNEHFETKLRCFVRSCKPRISCVHPEAGIVYDGMRQQDQQYIRVFLENNNAIIASSRCLYNEWSSVNASTFS